MKRTITLIYSLLMALSVAAQARFSSHTEQVSLGQIEWKHPTVARFVITNAGNQPLVLTYVEPDCDCSTVEWTETPIAPGEKGEIRVTFDAQLLGHFHKSVAVMTNASPQLLYLHITGEVVTEIKDFTKTHPYQFGQIRVDQNSLDFPDLYRGSIRQLKMSVVNLSDGPYEPVLMHLPSYLQAECNPAVLQKGEKGVITITLDANRLADLGLTQSSVYVARFAGDKVSEENEIPVSAILLPDVATLDNQQQAKAPRIRLSAEEIDFKAQLIKKQKAKQDILLTNEGGSVLDIRKLQVFHPAVGVALKRRLLQPGETTKLRVTLDKRHLSKSRRPLRLLMITNDPQHLKKEINIIVK